MPIADELSSLPDSELAQRLGRPVRTIARIRPLLIALSGNHAPQSPEQLAATLDWRIEVVRRELNLLVSAVPEIFTATCEFMPDVRTVINQVEARMGLITSANLHEANRVCARIVDEIVRPRYASFTRRALHAHIDAADVLTIPIPELVTFLLSDYRTFVRQQDQGLTSKAGGLNEAILVRGLKNSGMEEGKDFEITGTRSKGDLAFYCDNVTPRSTLLAEVKSYGARERLLRGLQDIRPPKVGVGFFTQASEFNPERTQQFLDTQSLAIYLPRVTYDALDPAARNRVNGRATPFYRPLEEFIGDMQRFNRTGEAAFSQR